MEKEKTHILSLFLLSIPVLVAVSGLLSRFDLSDFIYLLLVGVIFARYYFKRKNHD